MRKFITRKLCMLLIACMGAMALQAQTNYLDGWNIGDDVNAAGWRGAGGEQLATANFYWRTNVGSPVSNGTNTMLYTKLADTKINYQIGTLPDGKIYQLTGRVWRRNGGSGSANFNFSIATDITSTTPLWKYSAVPNGNNIAMAFTSSRIVIPSAFTDPVYLLWDVHVNSGSWAEAGVWDFALTEMGNALTVAFNTDGGSDVVSQYVLEGANEKATEPATNPTKAGYVFEGWYADADLTIEYDFNTVVTTDITVYAKWIDIKEGLKGLISTAEDLLKGGTQKGITYLQGIIDTAQTVVDDEDATVEEVESAFNAITDAIPIYQDASLSDLSVNGATISGFSATSYQYNYSLAPAVAVPTVAASGAVAAEIVITQAENISGMATISVTAGNGAIKEYTIDFIVNYMTGWDANGDTSKTPYDAGWRCSDSSVTWGAVETNNAYYRDNLNKGGLIGRVFMHTHNTSVFSYPISNLKAGKVYTFTCSGGKMSDNTNRTITFAVNTTQDGSGTVLGYQTQSVVQWNNGYSNFQFTFMPLVDGTYYLTWQTENNGGTDRSFAWNFKVLETATAITPSNVGSFSNGALSIFSQLTLEGDFNAANITTLASKLGTNDVLTTVDFTNATVAADATDIFAALNPNIIKLFATADAPADWTNVVVGNTAEEIEFTDGYPFDNTQTFTATTMTYNRTFVSGWSTFCLPFNMNDISELGTVEEFDEVKEDNGTIAFKVATSIEAGKAYLINTEGEEIFSGSNVQFPLTEPTSDNAFKGTFSELTGTDAEGKLILVLDEENDNKETFMTATDEATIPAFRAYISLLAGRKYAIVHDNNGATNMENEAADNGAELTVYASNGSIIIKAAIAQQVIISGIDGRALQTITLSAGESTTISNLAAGIYLVNNQKVAVR